MAREKFERKGEIFYYAYVSLLVLAGAFFIYSSFVGRPMLSPVQTEISDSSIPGEYVRGEVTFVGERISPNSLVEISFPGDSGIETRNYRLYELADLKAFEYEISEETGVIESGELTVESEKVYPKILVDVIVREKEIEEDVIMGEPEGDSGSSSCQSNSECSSGFVCLNSRCVETFRDPKYCSVNDDCSGGLCLSGVCKQANDNNRPAVCFSDAGCGSGFECLSGSCVQKKGGGTLTDIKESDAFFTVPKDDSLSIDDSDNNLISVFKPKDNSADGTKDSSIGGSSPSISAEGFGVSEEDPSALTSFGYVYSLVSGRAVLSNGAGVELGEGVHTIELSRLNSFETNFNFVDYEVSIVPGSVRLVSGEKLSDDSVQIKPRKPEGKLVFSTDYEVPAVRAREVSIDLSKARIPVPSSEEFPLSVEIYSPERLLVGRSEFSVGVKSAKEGYQFSVNVDGKYYGAVVDGEDVQWVKEVSFDEGAVLNSLDSVKEVAEIPRSAEIVSTTWKDEGGADIASPIDSSGVTTKAKEDSPENILPSDDGVVNEIPNGDSFDGIQPEDETEKSPGVVDSVSPITGNAVVSEGTSVKIVYKTPAPKLDKVEYFKEQKRYVLSVSSPDDVHYEDVLLAFDKFYEDGFKIDSLSRIEAFWLSDKGKIALPIEGVSLNGEEISGVFLTIPEMSNQTIEIIILVSEAEHLNAQRIFVDDVYEQVRFLDDNWTDYFPVGDFLRVTFEQPLDNEKDITIYARANESANVEIYLKDGTDPVGVISSITDEGFYKVYLTSLPDGFANESFDLRVVGGEVQFDFVIDPSETTPSVAFTSETPASESFVGSNGFSAGLVVEDLTNTFSFVDFNKDLLLWLGLESGEIVDLSSHGNPVFSEGGIFMSEGKWGDAIGLDGRRTALTVYDSEVVGFDDAEPYTLAGWFYVNSFDNDANAGFLRECTAAAGFASGYSLYVENENLILDNCGDSNGRFVSSAIINQGEWNHVALVLKPTSNGVVSEIFVNGESAGSTSALQIPLSPGESLLIGESWNSAKEKEVFLAGLVDEFVIFRRALSAEEISALVGEGAYAGSFANLASGTYSLQGFAVNDFGNRNTTESRILNVGDSISVSQCGAISSPGYYALVNNLVSSESCIQINSAGVIFDGAGFTIQGDGGESDKGVEILSSGGDSVVKNLNIVNFGEGLSFAPGASEWSVRGVSLSGAGIVLSGASENYFENDSINGAVSGIVIKDGSNENHFSNVAVTAGSQNGILISGGDENVFEGVVVSNSGSVDGGGIVILNGEENRFVNVAVSGAEGFYDLRIPSSSGSGNKFVESSFGEYLIGSGSSRVEDLDFENSHGKISFLEGVYGEGDDLSRDLVIKENSAFVNGAVEGFDVPSEVTLILEENDFVRPKIFRDGVACSQNACVNSTPLTDDVVVFKVPGWSEYVVGDLDLPVVTPISPANGELVFDSTPTFSWNGNKEGLVYEFALSLAGEGLDACSDLRDNVQTLGESYTLTVPLECLYDDGNYYLWSVRAGDSSGFGPWSEPRTLKIGSAIVLSSEVDSIVFDSNIVGVQSTEDNSPAPIVLNNRGNVVVEVDVEASDLWASELNPSNNYRFKFDDAGDLPSFDFGSSINGFTPLPSSNSILESALQGFSPASGRNRVEVEFEVSRPRNEPPGRKSSIVTFIAKLSEGLR